MLVNRYNTTGTVFLLVTITILISILFIIFHFIQQFLTSSNVLNRLQWNGIKTLCTQQTCYSPVHHGISCLYVNVSADRFLTVDNQSGD